MKKPGMPYYLWEVLPEMFADKLPARAAGRRSVL